jgi:hypothetical protein
MFPSCYAASSPQSGRESTYRAVQFWPATSANRKLAAYDTEKRESFERAITDSNKPLLQT